MNKTIRVSFKVLDLLVIFMMTVGLPTAGFVTPALAAPAAQPLLTTIPSNFFTVVDSGGPNDVNSEQNDLTQMGRDDTNPSYYDLFWSWDTTNFTAQKGNACALFDTNNNGNIDYAVCAEIENVPAGNINVVEQTAVSPLAVTCSDAKPDRCAQPSNPLPFTASDIQTGDLTSLAASPPANLVTDTDPFPNLNPDQTWPNDSTIQLKILKSFLPANAVLANVCTYPSLGNTGNNNPFDCVVTPGGGYLKVTKVAPDGTTQVFDFTVNPGSLSKSITGAGTTGAFPVPIGTNYSVAETVPTNWQLTTAACALEDGTSTGTKNANSVTGITIQSGKITTCTFTDSLQTGTLTLVKVVDNLGETGPGYKTVSDFPLSIDGTSATSSTAVTVPVGNHTIAETSQTGYTVGTWSCTDGTSGTAGSTSATVNISGGENTTCTMTNTLVAAPALSLVKTASPATYSKVGDVISYSYEVKNTGNVTLAGPVTVTDDKASVTCPSGGLAPGASMTCTASYSITQADLDSGSVKNTAQAHANGTDSNFDDETVTAVPAPHLSITKSADLASYNAVGQVITYTIVATNDGNVTLHNVVVTDAQVTDLSCSPTTPVDLAPGASITCTASHTITQDDLNAGSFYNQTCVDDGPGGAVSKCADVTTPGSQTPALSVTKVATESGFSAVNDVIHYTITAKNTGNVTLHNVTVIDAQVTDLSCSPTTPVDLVPGASITCTASHTISQADLDAGSFYNQACVDDGNGGADSKCADVTTPGSQTPHLKITKVATEAGFSAVNDVIHYTIVATNDGNVTLHNVDVTDSQVSNLVCNPTVPVSNLAPGDAITCTASHTIVQADLDVGSFYNQACVDDGAAGADQQCADVTTPGTQTPALSITKVATESGFSAVNDVIHYTIQAKNAGNVTLHNVVVTDPNVTDLTCDAVTDLAPGASINCIASHTITQADLDAGHFYNQACVDDGTGGADSKCADVTTPGTQTPALSITKKATESGFSALGDVIHYAIVATNTGNVTLHNVVVTDPNVTDLTCDAVTDLAPGGVINCTASHTITQDDLDAGTFYNQACVDDGTGGADQQCADVTTPGTRNPTLSITKVATEAGFSAVNDVIHYTIQAKNTGNVTLHNVTVTDPNVGDLTCVPANGSDLAPNATMDCTASHTITQSDLDAGSFYNQACVDDGTGSADQQCADVTTPGTQNPHLKITKVATEAGFIKVGDVINYTVTATNDGNVTLHNVDVTDAQVTDLSCSPSTPVDLAPGGVINCTASHTITQADLDAGSFYNQACVDDGTGGADSKCADVTTPGTQNPAITLTKSANPTFYSKVGDIITYTLVAKNTGNVTLHDVTITDPKLGTLTCTPVQPSTLAPGASMTCTGTYTIQAADLTVLSVTNTATVNGKGPQDQPVSATASATVYRQTAALLPTQTTCQQYAAGPSAWPAMYAAFTYQVKSNKINSVSPGVIFYYNTIIAPSASFTLTVVETNSLTWKPMLIQDLGQAILYTANCSKASGVTVTTTNNPYTVKFTVTGATPGAVYYIGIKYSPQNLVGQAVKQPYPTSIYTWATTGFNGSTASIPVKYKK